MILFTCALLPAYDLSACTACLTDLQLRVGLTQAPLDAAVTVCLLKQRVQNLSDCLSLIHHQCLRAAVTHQHLYYQLEKAAS